MPGRSLEIKLYHNPRGSAVPSPRDGDYPTFEGEPLVLQNSDFIAGLPMEGITADATPTRLAVPLAVDEDTPDVLVLEDDTVYAVEVTVAGRQDNGDAVVVHIRGAIKRDVGVASTLIVDTPVVEELRSGLTTATAAIVADVADGGLGVQVTGEAASNINWTARLRVLGVQ